MSLYYGSFWHFYIVFARLVAVTLPVPITLRFHYRNIAAIQFVLWYHYDVAVSSVVFPIGLVGCGNTIYTFRFETVTSFSKAVRFCIARFLVCFLVILCGSGSTSVNITESFLIGQ